MDKQFSSSRQNLAGFSRSPVKSSSKHFKCFSICTSMLSGTTRLQSDHRKMHFNASCKWGHKIEIEDAEKIRPGCLYCKMVAVTVRLWEWELVISLKEVPLEDSWILWTPTFQTVVLWLPPGSILPSLKPGEERTCKDNLTWRAKLCKAKIWAVPKPLFFWIFSVPHFSMVKWDRRDGYSHTFDQICEPWNEANLYETKHKVRTLTTE